MTVDFNKIPEKTLPCTNGGSGKAICNGKAEIFTVGVCHVCKKGSSHSIINTGDEDLVMLTVVSEK